MILNIELSDHWICIYNSTRRSSSKWVGVDGHILYACFSQRAECLLIDREFLYFIQGFQAIYNPVDEIEMCTALQFHCSPLPQNQLLATSH